MKKLFLIIMTITLILSISGCSNSSENSAISDTKVYEDDYIKFEYNPDVITNMQLDGIADKDFVIAKFLDDVITDDINSITDMSCAYIMVWDSQKDGAYSLFQKNYKLTYSTMLNSLLDTEEIEESDIEGSMTTTVKCNKILSNGSEITTKLVSIDENRYCIIICNALSSLDSKSKKELMTIYDTVICKESNNTDSISATYNDDRITANYNSDLLSAKNLVNSDNGYMTIIYNKSATINTDDIFKNSAVLVMYMPIQGEYGNTYINDANSSAIMYNSFLKTDEITAADISDGSFDKKMNDGRILRGKFIKSTKDEDLVVINSIMPGESEEIAKELETAYNNLNN